MWIVGMLVATCMVKVKDKLGLFICNQILLIFFYIIIRCLIIFSMFVHINDVTCCSLFK